MNGVVVRPNGSREVLELGCSDASQLKALQGAVGGYVEALTVPLEPPMVLWVNEHGALNALELNQWATMFMGYPIVGAVAVTGGPDHHGGVRSIPEIWRLMLLDGLIPGVSNA